MAVEVAIEPVPPVSEHAEPGTAMLIVTRATPSIIPPLTDPGSFPSTSRFARMVQNDIGRPEATGHESRTRMRDPKLWQRCLDYSLPRGPEGQDFAAWCAEEADITPSQAKGLLRDYKRFTYLAASHALEDPVAAGLVGRVAELHEASGDGPRYRREVLNGASWRVRARLRRAEREALTRAYEAEFGEAPYGWYWDSRSKAVYWAIAALFIIAGAGLAALDGSLAPLALGGIPAALVLLYARTRGKMAGSNGMSDAARYGGGMGGAG